MVNYPNQFTEIQFSPMAITLQVPHIGFKNNSITKLTIDFGSSTQPTTLYQGVGLENKNETIIFRGGGGITLSNSPNSIRGSVQLQGYPLIKDISTHNGEEPFLYSGSVVLTIKKDICEIKGELIGINHLGNMFQGKIIGKGNVNTYFNIRKILFPNLSIHLYLNQ